MKKHYVYWVFSEYSDNGYVLCVETSNKGIPKGWHFVAEIDLPEIDTKEVTKAAVTALDNQIVDLRVNIEKVEEKKKQLLALNHGGV